MNPVNNCSNCQFATKQTLRDANGAVAIGHSVYVCKRFPPVPVLVPQGGGVSINAQFPVVNESITCHEWRQDSRPRPADTKRP